MEYGGGALFVAWAVYAFLYAPSRPASSDVSDRADPGIAVRAAVLQAFHVLPRFELLKGANLDIYMTQGEFEGVAFPDRSSAIDRVGAAWCDEASLTFIPTVRIRDTRTGSTLGRYSCTGHWLRKRWLP
jgi:hypothetical protein